MQIGVVKGLENEHTFLLICHISRAQAIWEIKTVTLHVDPEFSSYLGNGFLLSITLSPFPPVQPVALTTVRYSMRTPSGYTLRRFLPFPRQVDFASLLL